MRLSLPVAVLTAATLAALQASAAPPAPPGHEISCSSARVARDYHEGLRHMHQGRLPQALQSFAEAARRDSSCAMAQWGLSRAFHRSGRAEEAAASAAAAQRMAVNGDDREQKLISVWAQVTDAAGKPDAERNRALGRARSELDLLLCLYPEDPEIWLLRGELAESPLRGTPFFLAALQLYPQHPAAQSWRPQVPPLPQVLPRAGEGAATRATVAPMGGPPPLHEGLGVLSFPITTSSPRAQAYFEQGMRCFHAYVTPAGIRGSAAQCFQQAALIDPNCAMAYWGLSFTGGGMAPQEAANRALELALRGGTDLEKRFCAARVLEMAGGPRRQEFLDALDGAIAAYPTNVELWMWRGKTFGFYGAGGGGAQAIPYHIAAHRLQPLHPSANHELIHNYEAIDRPALGWPYTEGFRRSAPNMPHAHHMQAHLAMRIGRWDEAIEATRLSRKKSLAGFPELDASHHIDILIRCLGHEGRFREAESEPRAYRDGLPWARLLQLKAVPAELEAWAGRRRAQNANDGFYIAALAALDRGDLGAAAPFVEHVEQQWRRAPSNIYRRGEVRGRYLVQSGQVEEGLKLMREAAAKAVGDSGLHAWGGGSYQMEVWGEAALRARRFEEAEEAFHEALAHEHGSIVAALGMQVVWEARGKPELAAHYSRRAAQIWKSADAGALERQLARLRALVPAVTTAERSQ